MKNIADFLFLFLVIYFPYSNINAQEKEMLIVRGYVVDNDSGDPLEAASVYFAQTTIGTFAKKGGRFILEVSKPGNYELVVSMIGYEMQRQNLYLEKGKEYDIKFKLVPKLIQVKPIIVMGEDREAWRKNLEIFKDKFLGDYAPADSCIMMNLEYLEFDWKGDFLIAKIDTPIVVINNFLGYKVTCELLHFEYNPHTQVKAIYIVPFFVDLLPENESRKEEWEENRRDIYLGSPEHFLRSLRYNRLDEEKYKVYIVDGIGDKDQELIRQVESWEDIRYEKQVSENPTIFFDKYLRIVYNRSELSYAYQRYSYFTIDPNGIADNHLPFIYYGFWSKRGVANLMPRNYLPEDAFK